jgi:hypothetical protein
MKKILFTLSLSSILSAVIAGVLFFIILGKMKMQEIKLIDLENEKKQVEQEIVFFEKTNDNLRIELQKECDKFEDLKTQLLLKKKEIRDFEAAKKAMETEKTFMFIAQKNSEEKIKSLQNEISKYKAQIQKMELQSSTVSSSTPTLPRVITSTDANNLNFTWATKLKSEKNKKELEAFPAKIEKLREDVIIIDYGTKHGASVGKELEIQENQRFLAKAVIIKVTAEKSAARVLKRTNYDLKQGQNVALLMTK